VAVSPNSSEEEEEKKENTGASSGEGTYVVQNEIHASVLGKVSYSLEGVCSVAAARPHTGSRLPEVGDRITGRITRINPRVAKVEILCVGTSVLTSPVSGVVRARDVRALDVDDIKMRDFFRPGDIVYAQVISLGDARSYYLSTAQNELGVLIAKSAAGYHMVPVAWDQMECPITHVKEKRKVAKVTSSASANKEKENQDGVLGSGSATHKKQKTSE
jgi:exosome complex component CSL4